jgi:hypothetical protein
MVVYSQLQELCFETGCYVQSKRCVMLLKVRETVFLQKAPALGRGQ